MTTDSTRTHGDTALGRFARKRWVPVAAAATAAALTAGAIASAGGGAAGAATAPLAQSVGNFVDATLGGSPIDQVVALKYASAKAPGSASVQNPLDVELLNAIDLPLTGVLDLPSILGIHLGAVTQKAQANVDGESYGQAGLALDAGGVAIGGDHSTDQAGNATIDLSASGLAGNSPIPVPGGTGTADALGGVKATLGGISAVAATPKGVDKGSFTNYQIANLNLQLGSPLLGQTLAPVFSTITTALQQVAAASGAVTQSLLHCDLTSGTVPTTLSLEGGAVVINPATASITIDLKALLDVLGLDLNALPANTDLISYLLAYLADPNGLAKGLQGLVDGLVNPFIAKYEACKGTIDALPAPLNSLVKTLLDTLISGKSTLETTVSGLVATLAGSAGVNPLAPLATLLRSLIDIGINVQPNGPAGPAGAAYVDPLAKTPKQGTPVVEGQTIERAIEVNVAAGAGASLPGTGSLPGLGGLPGLGSLGVKSVTVPKSVKAAATAGSGNTGLLTLALANAAAGPSAAAVTPPSSSAPPSSAPPSTGVPTGVPAGQGTHGGSPMVPLILLLLGLMFAGGGVVAYRMRTTLNQH